MFLLLEVISGKSFLKPPGHKQDFFSNTSQSKKCGAFKCSSQGSCWLDSDKEDWTKCQKCRFVKCLQAGMATSAVMIGKKKKKKNEVEGQKKLPELALTSSSLAARQPSPTVTLEKKVFLTELLRQNLESQGTLAFEEASHNPDFVLELLGYYYKLDTVSFSTVHKLETYFKQRGCGVFSKLDDMLRLPPGDQGRARNKSSIASLLDLSKCPFRHFDSQTLVSFYSILVTCFTHIFPQTSQCFAIFSHEHVPEEAAGRELPAGLRVHPGPVAQRHPPEQEDRPLHLRAPRQDDQAQVRQRGPAGAVGLQACTSLHRGPHVRRVL